MFEDIYCLAYILHILIFTRGIGSLMDEVYYRNIVKNNNQLLCRLGLAVGSVVRR